MMHSQFRKIFEAYGADYQSTMERFMGNEKMYLKLLDMLFQDENLQKLGIALESNNRNEAFEAAHTLKGVVANMGLTPLYNSICAMVEFLRSGEPYDNYTPLYQAICLEFHKVDKLRSALNNSSNVGH